jgi:hypothetical protein
MQAIQNFASQLHIGIGFALLSRSWTGFRVHPATSNPATSIARRSPAARDPDTLKYRRQEPTA